MDSLYYSEYRLVVEKVKPNMHNNPTEPNWYAQPHFQQYPPPPPPPARKAPAHRRFGQWYRAKSKGAQAGLGCVGVLLILTLCGLCSTAASLSGQTAVEPTPTVANAVLASTGAPTTAELPTHTPTSRPTATPTPKPTAKPTAKPTPRPTQKPTGVNGNPWGYDFTPGNLIYHPPAAFCDYFACISTFWNGQGYVMECQDGMYSKSGGRSGSCSHHGGNWRPLYSH